MNEVRAVIELKITPQRECGFGKIAQKVYFPRGFFRDFCKMGKTQARFRRNGPDNQTGSFPFWEKTNPMRMAAMAKATPNSPCSLA